MAYDKPSGKIVVRWIRLPKLPLNFLSETLLRDISSRFGTLLQIDMHTRVGKHPMGSRIVLFVDVLIPYLREFGLMVYFH